MKKFLHKLPIWATVLSVLLCSVLSINIQPSFASSGDTVIPWSYTEALSSPSGFIVNLDLIETFEYPGSLILATLENYDTNSPTWLSPGTYYVSGVSPVGNVVTNNSSAALSVLLIFGDEVGDVSRTQVWQFNEPFTVDEGEFVTVVAQSYNVTPVLYKEYIPTPPLYYTAFQMFADFIYGEGAVLTTEQNFTMTILATALSLLVVLLPFIIVYALIILFGRY